MSRMVSIGVCVLVSTVTLGIAVNAGAKAGGSLSQTGEPAITGQMTFAGGTWTASGSGATFTKADPGGWSSQFTFTIPSTIPAEGAEAKVKVTSTVSATGARHNASAKVILGGIATTGGPPGNAVSALAEVGETKSNEMTLTLTPQSSSSAFLEIQMQDGPQVRFDYQFVAPPAPPDPCASAREAPLMRRATCVGGILAVPSPGESATVSGPLAGGAPKATVGVSSSDGSLADKPIVGEGSVEDKKKGTKGEQVAACWLLGPGALVTDPAAVASILSEYSDVLAAEFKRFDAGGGTAEQNLGFCTLLVDILVAVQAENPPPARRAAASGCSHEFVFSGKAKNGKLKLKLEKPKALPKTAVKYSCAETAGGGAELTAKSSNKKGLRGELGKTLDLGVVRAPDAPASDATLAFGFTS